MEGGGLLRTIPDLELRDPGLNLALEESIARSVSSGSTPPTVRFWRDERSAVLGRSQAAETELDPRRCGELDLPIVRRPSGGGTVLHHPGNLNYSLYLPEPGTGTVLEETVRLSRPVASALKELGPEPRIERNGLFFGEDKIGGTAQSRRWGLLHHGTLLLRKDGVMGFMEELLRAQSEEYGELEPKLPSEPSEVIELEELAEARVEEENLVENLGKKFAERLDLTPVSGRISGEEWRRAFELARRKYSSEGWTFRFGAEGEETRERKTEEMIVHP